MGPKELITWGIATSLVLNACNTKATPTIDLGGGGDLNTPTPESTPTPVPEFIPSPTATFTPTPIQDIFAYQNQENAWFGTPGAINTAIAHTQENIDWNVLMANNFPEKAIYSSVKIMWDDGFQASANILHDKGWWYIFTAGHSFENNSKILTLFRNGMPNEGTAFFYHFGFAYMNNPDGRDFGVIALPDQVIDSKGFDNLFSAQVLTWEDLSFEEPQINEALNGVCFPGTMAPTVVENGNIIAMTGVNPDVDNVLISGGCSGGGFFNSQKKYIGPVVSAVTQDLLTSNPPFYYDDAWVTSLHSIGGEDALKELIKQAQNNFLGK